MRTFYTDFFVMPHMLNHEWKMGRPEFGRQLSILLLIQHIQGYIADFDLFYNNGQTIFPIDVRPTVSGPPALDDKVYVSIDFWFDSPHTIQIMTDFFVGGELIARVNAALAICANSSYERLTFPPELVKKIGPHVRNYTASDISLLAPTFAELDARRKLS